MSKGRSGGEAWNPPRAKSVSDRTCVDGVTKWMMESAGLASLAGWLDRERTIVGY